MSEPIKLTDEVIATISSAVRGYSYSEEPAITAAIRALRDRARAVVDTEATFWGSNYPTTYPEDELSALIHALREVLP